MNAWMMATVLSISFAVGTALSPRRVMSFTLPCPWIRTTLFMERTTISERVEAFHEWCSVGEVIRRAVAMYLSKKEGIAKLSGKRRG